MLRKLDSFKREPTRAGALFTRVFSALLLSGGAFAGSIDLSFSSLPSAQGFTYISTSATPENQIFSVNGTTLSLDSESLPANANGGYFFSGAYNPALSTTIEIVMEVNPGTTASSNDFQVRAGGQLFDFGFSDSGVRILSNFVPLMTTGAFHNYEIILPGGTGTYSFYQDGILESSGTGLSGSFGTGFFSFGEEDIHGSGNAEFTELNYMVSPEPASWMFCGLALGVLGLRARGYRIRQSFKQRFEFGSQTDLTAHGWGLAVNHRQGKSLR